MALLHRLVAQRATPENTASLGVWLGSEAQVPAIGSDFYGEAVTLRKPGAFVTDETLTVSIASLRRRPLQVSYLERHFLHTQTFIPLGGKPMLLVLAPPTPEAELPGLETLRALIFDGRAGIALHIGTWHEFPLPLVDDTDVVVLLRRDTIRDLKHKRGNEALGPDLDKKDVVARCGVLLEVVLG